MLKLISCHKRLSNILIKSSNFEKLIIQILIHSSKTTLLRKNFFKGFLNKYLYLIIYFFFLYLDITMTRILWPKFMAKDMPTSLTFMLWCKPANLKGMTQLAATNTPRNTVRLWAFFQGDLFKSINIWSSAAQFGV